MLVEVTEADANAQVTRGLRPGAAVERLTGQAHRTFEEAVDSVQPAAQSLIRRFRNLADAPHEVRVEFGMDLHAEAGAFIAAASTGANFKVTLTWRHDESWFFRASRLALVAHKPSLCLPVARSWN